MKIRTGDTIVVIAGKSRGKTGRIVRVYPETNRVLVEGINIQKRHTKERGRVPGGIIERPASIHASNVMMIDPKTNKRTRVGYRIAKDGTKERFGKKSGQAIVIASAAAPKVAPKKKKAAAAK